MNAADLFTKAELVHERGCRCGGVCCPMDYMPEGYDCSPFALMFEKPGVPTRWLEYARLPAGIYPFRPGDEESAVRTLLTLLSEVAGPSLGPDDPVVVVGGESFRIRYAPGAFAKMTGPGDKFNLAVLHPVVVERLGVRGARQP